MDFSKVHDLLRLYNEIDVPHDRLLFKIPATWQVSVPSFISKTLKTKLKVSSCLSFALSLLGY